MKSTQQTVLIAASGSGGHLIPALVVAEEADSVLSAHVHLVGSGRPLEQQLFQKSKYQAHAIPITGISGRGLAGVLQFVKALPSAVRKTQLLIKELKPDIVVGIGGYASVLPVLCAWFHGIPTIIHEAEKELGLANKFLSFFASRISLAHKETKVLRQSRARYCGHPTRVSVTRSICPPDTSNAISHILVLGGSQGSQFLDEHIPKILSEVNIDHLEVWHQCRAGSESSIHEQYKSYGISAKVVSFIDAMHEAYNWSHIIISRSGAGSVAEIAQTGRPTVFVPFPYAANNHQLTNALPLVEKGQALLIEESMNFDSLLLDSLSQISQPEKYAQMLQPIAATASEKSAARAFTELVGELLEDRKSQ